MADIPRWKTGESSWPMPPEEAGRIAGDWAGTLCRLNNMVAELMTENRELKERLMTGAALPHEPTEDMIEAGKVARIADFQEHGTTLSPNDARRVCRTVWQAMHRAAMLSSSTSEGSR